MRDRYLLALCYRLKADLDAALSAVDSSKLVESIDAYTKAQLAMQDLSRRSPAVHRYRVELGQLLMNIGQLEAQQQHYAAAQTSLQKAEEVFAGLAEEDPDSTEFRELLRQVQDVLQQLKELQSPDASN